LLRVRSCFLLFCFFAPAAPRRLVLLTAPLSAPRPLFTHEYIPKPPPKQIPGVPIMYLSQHRYSIERLPEATIGGAPRT
jgi:hypothetical protein